MEGGKIESQLGRLWSECFEADETCFSHFFHDALPQAVTFVAVKDRTCACLPQIRYFRSQALDKLEAALSDEHLFIASSLHIFPLEYISKASPALSGGYLYAVATLPEWRKRGYATLLIQAASSWAAQNGMSYLLTRPAEPALFEYYCKLGFTERLFRDPASLPACEKLSEVHKMALDAVQAYSFREKTWSELFRQVSASKVYKNKPFFTHTNDSEISDAEHQKTFSGYFRWNPEELKYIISLDEDSAPEPADVSKPYALLKPLSSLQGAASPFYSISEAVFSFPME
jgi:GNAT superfamily N-acetyltransferase